MIFIRLMLTKIGCLFLKSKYLCNIFSFYALKLKACFANCCRFYLVVSRKWRTFAPSSALVVELVDTPDLGSGAFGRVSSSLIRRTSEGTFVVPSFCFIRRTKQEETKRPLLIKIFISTSC